MSEPQTCCACSAPAKVTRDYRPMCVACWSAEAQERWPGIHPANLRAKAADEADRLRARLTELEKALDTPKETPDA